VRIREITFLTYESVALNITILWTPKKGNINGLTEGSHMPVIILLFIDFLQNKTLAL
jgi:hypothetical protein